MAAGAEGRRMRIGRKNLCLMRETASDQPNGNIAGKRFYFCSTIKDMASRSENDDSPDELDDFNIDEREKRFNSDRYLSKKRQKSVQPPPMAPEFGVTKGRMQRAPSGTREFQVTHRRFGQQHVFVLTRIVCVDVSRSSLLRTEVDMLGPSIDADEAAEFDKENAERTLGTFDGVFMYVAVSIFGVVIFTRMGTQPLHHVSFSHCSFVSLVDTSINCIFSLSLTRLSLQVGWWLTAA
jgi:hypothetical protein